MKDTRDRSDYNARRRELYQRPETKNKRKQWSKIYRESHPLDMARREINRKRNGTPKYRFDRLVAGCKKANREMTIPFDEYEKLCNQPCTYCQNKMCADSIRQGCGLDRIDNTKGYTPDNVNPSCGICNCIRGPFLNVEETKRAIAVILEYRSEHNIPANHYWSHKGDVI